MGWISFCLFALLISSCHLKPLEEAEEVNGKEEMVEASETPNEDLADTAAVVDENEIKKYNDYMDAVYRRMNAALRAKLMDPMELNLDAKDERKGKKKNKKDSAKRVTREADEEIMEAEEEENEDEVERMGESDDEVDMMGESDDEVDRMGELDEEVDRIGEVEKEKKKKTNKRKNGKNKKKERQEEDDAEMEENKKKKKRANKNKKSNKSKERKEKKSSKKERRAEKKARKAAKKQEREAAKNKEREAAKNNEEGDESTSLSRERRNKQSKGRGSRKQKRKDSDEGKARGSLSGIATLRRSGSVEITEEEDHKIISSEFTVGPLQLEVSKSFGEAKERQVKTAKASTDVMKGVMVLKVKADGSAHVKKVVFKKPDHVDVSGSLSAKERKSETQLRNSFNRSRGLAAQKILKTARYVLKNTE